MSVENNNYTINSVEYIITESAVIVDELGQNFIELTIIPNSNYTVTASDFSLATPANPTYVTSVVFTQSGDNVLVTINLVTTAIMPQENLDLGICISGSAQLAELTIDGVYNTEVESQILPASETNVAYSGTGDQGDLTTLFTKTFTANSGFYITTTSVIVTQGNAANYSFEEAPVYNGDGYMTSVTYTVKYLFPSESISGDVIDFTIRDKGIPVVQPSVVSSYSEIPTYILVTGENIAWTLYGQSGAQYSASMTDGSQTITIATNETIQANGQSTVSIEFPEYTGTTFATWTITLTGDLATPFQQPNPIIVYQYAPIDITVTAESSDANITYTPFAAGNFQTGNVFSVEALQSPVSPIVQSLGGTITISSGSISFIDEPHFGVFEEKEYNPIAGVNGSVSNSSTLVIQNLVDGPIEVGSRFFTRPPESPNEGYAIQEYEVSNVNGNTLTVSPNITISDGEAIGFYKTNGNIVENNPLLDLQQISSNQITVNFDLELSHTGDRDTTFTLQLDNFLNVSTGGQLINACFALKENDLCCLLPTPVQIYIPQNETFQNATTFYTDASLQTVAPAGFYSININCSIP